MYIIDQVDVQYEAYYDQHAYTIWYRNDIGESIGLNIALNSYDLYKAYSPEEYLAEAVAKHDPKLYPAMREWIDMNAAGYQPKWKSLGVTDKPVDFQFKKGDHIQYDPPKYSDHNKHVHFAIDVNSVAKSYDKGGLLFPGEAAAYKSNYEDAGVAELPGLNERVKHPPITNPAAQCGDEERDGTVRGMVMHLNDWHKWTREEIADWLETLDVDLRFKSPDAKLREVRQKKINAMAKSMDSLTANIESWNKLIKSATEEFNKLHEAMTKLQEEQNEQAG